MKFEHAGLNTPDARAMAAWYIEHCGMCVARSFDTPPHVHFLADETGRVVMEIYTNPLDPVPDYWAQHPVRLHVAFAVTDAAATTERLLAAGASLIEESRPDDGSHLVMLRDPWGVPLQLCKRATPLV